ncbi:hypothetical protein GCM10023317_12950 [Actinopolymorpha pittospori]
MSTPGEVPGDREKRGEGSKQRTACDTQCPGARIHHIRSLCCSHMITVSVPSGVEDPGLPGRTIRETITIRSSGKIRFVGERSVIVRLDRVRADQ